MDLDECSIWPGVCMCVLGCIWFGAHITESMCMMRVSRVPVVKWDKPEFLPTHTVSSVLILPHHDNMNCLLKADEGWEQRSYSIKTGLKERAGTKTSRCPLMPTIKIYNRERERGGGWGGLSWRVIETKEQDKKAEEEEEKNP